MKYGIFGDIHSNLEAFNAVLEEYSKEKIDGFFCIGDIVGYAAKPNECIKKIKEIGAAVVAGNHEWAVIEKTDLSYFNPVAKQAILWTKDNLTEESVTFLKSLELVLINENLSLVHGMLNHPEEFDYLTESSQAQENFTLMNTNICFLGHSHMPGVFIKDNDEISYSKKTQISISKDKKYIINVGSVGQPRDGDSRACYCIYDIDNNVVEFKRVNYNIDKAQKEIAQAGLPAYLAYRLSRGG